MRKVEYVIDMLRMIVEGIFNLLEFLNMMDEDIMKKLIKIRGIGLWIV